MAPGAFTVFFPDVIHGAALNEERARGMRGSAAKRNNHPS